MRLRKDPLAASNLAKTILKTNPGIDRVVGEKLEIAEKLNSKKTKMSDYQRRLFMNKFEGGRKYRSSLYNRLRPKLDGSTRNTIEKYKIEYKKSQKPYPSKIFRSSSRLARRPKEKLLPQKSVEMDNLDSNVITSFEETETQDLSRRSSLHSSILPLEVTRGDTPECAGFTENPLGGIDGGEEKPEVVVTKVKSKDEGSDGKLANYLNLIPAPTPTRFVGKMAKVKEDKKKKEGKSKPSSRRSSIFPSTETIQEVAEAASTPPAGIGQDNTGVTFFLNGREKCHDYKVFKMHCV